MITDEQFRKLMDVYKPEFIKWHHHIRRFLKIDRDTFLEEFQYILFRSMRRFDIAKAKAEYNRFDRYFHAALKKSINSLIRNNLTNKRKRERHNVSFSLKKHDLADKVISNPLEYVIADDLISVLTPLQNSIASMKVKDYSAEEICKKLKITLHSYRVEMAKIRSNRLLQQKL